MSDKYNESAVNGMEWQRCYQIVIDNPVGGAPSAMFHEERVLVPQGSASRKWPVGHCAMGYDPDQIIKILDPVTGEETGKLITGAELYAAIYSAYLHTAKARDGVGAELIEESVP